METGLRSKIEPTVDYNPIAGFYRKHWCCHYHPGLAAMLERVLLSCLPPEARILDLFGGTGAIAKHLVSEGFVVTGIDVSERMLAYARAEAPEAMFVAADVRTFCFPPVFDAAICTFDSLSYILSREELEQVFSNVHAALRPHGRFVFDLSTEEAYRSD